MIKKLFQGLARARQRLGDRLRRIITRRDPKLLEEIEEVLYEGDLGVELTENILEELRKIPPEKYMDRIKEILISILEGVEVKEKEGKPRVWMFVGVNGVGKTTTIGKIGKMLRKEGKRVLFAACDTYRTGAQEQLKIWAERVGADIVLSQYGADPGAVAFDAYEAAVHRGMDELLIDTAGRLHTKHPLMEEMKKIKRVLSKKNPDAPHEIVLVVDGTTGQNALNQAKSFHEALGLSGIVLTKLDGTAKGGIVVHVVKEIGVPVRYIGVGEGEDDLIPFNPEEFVKALLG